MGVAPNFVLETWKTARSNQIMTHGLSAATHCVVHKLQLDYILLIVKINAEFVYRHAPGEVLAYERYVQCGVLPKRGDNMFEESKKVMTIKQQRKFYSDLGHITNKYF